MQNPLITYRHLALKIAEAIELKNYFTASDAEGFTHYIREGFKHLHIMGLLLSNKQHLNLSDLFYHTHLDKFYSTQSGNFSGFVFKSTENDFIIYQDGRCLETYISMRDLVGAFVFFNIAQAQNGFDVYMSSLTAESFNSSSIITVPNPFLRTFNLGSKNLSVLQKNVILSVVFSLIQLTMNIMLQKCGRIKIKHAVPDYKLEHLIEQGRTNCKTEANLNSLKCVMLRVTEDTYMAHKNAFIEVNQYQGTDVGDWMFYRFFRGTINAGAFEDLYAISPSLGIKRCLSTVEFYYIGKT